MTDTNIGIRLTAQGGDEVNRSLQGIERGVSGLGASLSKIGNIAAGLQALPSIFNGTVGAVVKMADSVTILNNQLKLATPNTQAAGQAFQALFEIAQKSRVSFTELGGTFASISRAGQALGVSQQRLLSVTESISNAITISGGSAESAKAALIQLSQGLASGTLRGDELNSVMEQTPRLAQALADGLKISTGELRKLGEAGEITASKVISALESQSNVLKGEVASSIMTVGQAWTQVTNATTAAVGIIDNATGASGGLAKGLSGLSSVITSVGQAFKDNETAISVTLGTLGGAAAVAGVGLMIGRIVTLTTSVGGLAGAVGILNATLAANPVTLALLGIGAVVGGGAALYEARSNSVEGLTSRIGDLSARVKEFDDEVVANGGKTTAALEARRAALEKLRDELQGKLDAKTQGGSSGIGGNGDRLLERSLAAQQTAADKGLDIVRASVKNELGIRQEGAKEALKINAAFQTSIEAASKAGDTTKAAALESERVKLLLGSVKETNMAVKGLNDKLNADGYESSKLALEKQIALLESGKARKLAVLQNEQVAAQSARDQDLINEQTYLSRRNKLELAAIDAQISATDAALTNTKKAKIDPKQKAQEEQKLNEELKKLADERYAIAVKFNAAQSLLAYKETEGQRKALEDDIEGLRKSNAALALHNEEIGLTVDQLNALILSRQDNAIKLLEETVNTSRANEAQGVYNDTLQEQIDKLKELKRERGLTADGQEKTKVAETAKKTLEDSKKIGEQLEGIITDGLMRGFENGKGFAENFRDVLENTFKTMILRPIVQATVQGALGLDGGAGGGGIGGFVSGLQAAGKAFESASFALTDFQGFAAFQSKDLGDALSKAGFDKSGDFFAQNANEIGAFAKQAGDILSYLEAATNFKDGSYGKSIGQGIGTYFLGPIGGQIGKEVGAVFDRVFGASVGPTAAGVNSSFDAQGNLIGRVKSAATSNASVDAFTSLLQVGYQQALAKFGATGKASTFGYQTTSDGKFDVSANVGGSSVFQQGTTAYSADALQLASSRAIFAALQASELPAYLSKAFTGIVANTASQEQINGALQFAESLKAIRFGLLTATEQQAEYQKVIDAGTASLGTSAATFKKDFIKAIDGGLTPEMLAQWSALGGTLQALDEILPKTAATIKSNVEQLKTQESFQDKINLLTKKTTQLELDRRDALVGSNAATAGVINAYFDLVAASEKAETAISDAATALGSLQARVANTMSARSAAEDLATAALDGVKESINVLKDDAQNTYNETIKDLDKQVKTLTLAYDAAVKVQEVLRDAATTTRDTLSAGLKAERIAAANSYKLATDNLKEQQRSAASAYKAAAEGATKAINAATKSLELIKGLDSALSGALNFFKGNDRSLLSRQAGQAVISQSLTGARQGVSPSDKALADALAAVTQPSEDFFASFADYQRDYFRTANDISDLSKLTEAQVVQEDAALKVLEDTKVQGDKQHQEAMDAYSDQLDALDLANENLLKIFEKRDTSIQDNFATSMRQIDDTLAGLRESFNQAVGRINGDGGLRDQAGDALKMALSALDKQLSDAQKSYDAVLGLTRALLPLPEALQNLARALANFKTVDKVADVTRVNTGNLNLSTTDIASSVNGFYKNNSGSQADALAYQYAVANGLSTNQIAGANIPGITLDTIAKYVNDNKLTPLDTLLTANGTDATTLANTAAVQAQTLVASNDPVEMVKAWYANLTKDPNWQQTEWGRALYEFVKSKGIRSADVDKALGYAPGSANAWALSAGLPAFARGTNFVPEDMIAQIHKGEAIIPAAFNPAQFGKDSGNDSLVQEIKTLREQVKLQQIALEAIAINTGKQSRLSQKWDVDGLPATTTAT